MKNLRDIEQLISGKRVALVGNSRNVLGKTYDVDNHDVVIRMNGAWNLPEEMKQSVGVKLDMLCVSGHKKEIAEIVKLYPNVVWMSPKSRETIEPEVASLLYYYPEEWWQELYKELGSRPSTGCMAVDLLRRTLNDGTLTLYGFDFFQNASWHKRYSLIERMKLFFGMDIYVNPHDGAKEAVFIKNCLPANQLSIIKP